MGPRDLPGEDAAEFKGLMGTAHCLAFPAAKAVFRPERLAAEVLRSIRLDAADQVEVEPTVGKFCVPAPFELPQSTATMEATRLAGFERVELLQEPVASALAAGRNA
jgi:molecular chaperone DnaK